MSRRCLRRGEDRAHIDCKRAVKVGKPHLGEGPKNRYAGVVDKDVNATQVSHGALYSANDCVRIGAVGLNGNCLNPEPVCGPGYLIRFVRGAGISQRNMGAILGKPLHNRSANPSTASGHEGTFIGKWFVHSVFSAFGNSRPIG
jgi:hypothetical protein